MAGSATSTGTLNATVLQLNFTFSLSAYHQHACNLAMPVGCDFDMVLYNPSNAVVASALTRSTAGSNESFVYFNNGPVGTFKIQVSRFSGNGPFTLSVVEVQKIVVDNLNPYVENFNANYNTTGLWASTANLNPWNVTDADFISSPTSMRLVGAGIPVFEPPVGAGTLDSPMLDLTGAYTYYLSLGYRFLLGAGNIQIRVNGTGAWNNLVTLNGLATAWTRVELNLTGYHGSHVQFRFSVTGVATTGYFYIDNLEVHTQGTASFSNPILTPLTGTIYEIFHLQITYRETHNVFPSEIYVSVWDGLVPNVKQVDLIETDPTDWDISNGKLYACDLQLFDVGNPILVCVSDRIAAYPLIQQPEMNEALSTGSFPYALDFEGGDVYYTINDPVCVAPALETNSSGHYFTTGTAAGKATDNAVVAYVGIATPWIHVTSGLQVFLECDLSFTEGIPLPVNALKINITADGATWNTMAEYTADFTGKPSINITSYNGDTVSIRVFMESAVIGGYRSASFTLDNVTLVEKDFIAPTMVNPSISDGQWLFGVVNVGMTVTDVGFGVDHVIVRVDGAYLVTITTIMGSKAEFTLDTARLENGDHEISITVVDESGNQNNYTIVVHVDNTPYWFYAAIAGAVAVLGIVAARKRKGIKASVQRKVRKESIPPTDVAKKILEVTNVFRRISAFDLVKKLAIKDLTASTVLAYLRYMIAEGMIKGDLDGDVFTRMMAGKMKAVLANKEAAILDYLRGRRQASVSEMIKDLNMEGIRKEAIEDYIMGLVVVGKLACYFEGDAIFCEDEATAKVKESLPEPVPAPTPAPAPRVAKKKEAPKETEYKEPEKPSDSGKVTKKPVKDTGAVVEAKKYVPPPPEAIPVVVVEPEETVPAAAAAMVKEEAPAKAPWTMNDKKDDIVRLLSSREHVTFEAIKKEFALHESTDEIEDFLFDLIKSRAIKGVIEDDGFSSRE